MWRGLTMQRDFSRQGSSTTMQRGFTLLELMVVLALGVLLVGVALPFGGRMYDTMQYRDAVRQINAAATAARYQAAIGGRAMDLLLQPGTKRYGVQPAGAPPDEDALKVLDGDVRLGVISAQEISPGSGLAAIRFYPQGGSTGGSVSLRRDNGTGVRLRVDWLLGRVTQEPLGQP